MTAPAEDTDVGGIVAHLRVQGGAEWAREFEAAQRHAEALGRVNPHVRISSNAAELQAQATALQARMEALARLNPDIRIRTNNAAVQADLAAIRARLEALGSENTTLRLDLTAAQAQIEALRQRTGRQGGIAGRDFGAQFSRGLRETLAAIPEIEVDGDTSDVDRQLAEVRAQLEELSRKRVGFDISAEDAMRSLAALQGELEALRAQAGDIDVRFNTAAATARLARLQAQLNGLTVTPDIDQGRFAARLAKAIKEASAALPKLDIDADSTPAQRELAEIRARMVALGDKKIGVDISAAEAAAKLKALQGELDRLSRKSKDDLRIRMDTAAASAKIAALRAEMNGLNGAGSGAGGLGMPGTGPLIFGAIVAGASLAGPLVGALTAGAIGLTGAVGAAALAYKGLQRDVQDDTRTGQKLKAEFHGIGDEIGRLETIAADRSAPGVIGALGKIRAFIPSLDGPIAGLSRHLGQALNTGVGGAISLLRTGTPLLDDFGKGAEHVADSFAHWAVSPEAAQFIAYARRELPIVAQDAADIGKALITIGTDLQPVGDALLQTVDGFAKGVKTADEFGDAINNAARKGVGALDSLGDRVNSNVRGLFGVDDSKNDDRNKARTLQAAQAQEKVAAYAAREDTARQRAAQATKAQEAQLQRLANRYHVSLPAMQAVVDGERKNAEQLALTTLQMQRQSDAGGLLKAALDALDGKQLSAAQTQNQFEQSLVSGAAAIESAKSAHNKYATSLGLTEKGYTGMADAEVANRSALLSQITAAESAAGAHGDLSKSSDKAKTRLLELRDQIIKNAVATGQNRDEVTRFIDSVLDINKLKVKPTQADFDDRSARIGANNFKKFLGGLPKSIRTAVELAGVSSAEYQLQMLARSRTARVNVVTTGGSTYQQAVGGRQVFADGGTVRGEGGPREDKVLVRVSPGEEIIQNGPAQKYNALIRAIRADAIPGFANGGTVGGSGTDGIVILNPKAPSRSRPYSHSTVSTKAKSKTAKAKKAPKPKEVILTLRATAGNGEAYGIASYVKGQIPSVQQATRLLSLAVNDAFTIKGIQAKMAAIKTDIQRLRELQQSIASSAEGKLTEGSDPGQFQSIGQYTAYLRAKGDQNVRYNTEVSKLRGNKALPADLLARFAADGPSSILDSLAGGSRADIAALVKANSRFDASVKAGRGQAAAIYGPSITAQNALLGKATAQSARTEQAMVSAVLKLAQIVNRPVSIKLDGKTVATTKYVDKELQGVIDELRNVLVTGRTG